MPRQEPSVGGFHFPPVGGNIAFPVGNRKTIAMAGLTSGMACTECAAKGRKGLMVPMSTGKGLRCNTPGNVFKGGKWTICGNTIWLKSYNVFSEVKLPRADKFPVIATPTEQQLLIRDWFANTPAVRGGRLLVSNAGPGCAKTSTAAWCLGDAHKRLGRLDTYPVVAFNRNARDVMITKLPAEVPDVFTMNGLGMKVQNYRSNHIDNGKLYGFFREQIKSLPKEDRPSFDGIRGMIDKMRAWGFYGPASETAYWETTIAIVAERYQVFGKNKKPGDMLKVFNHYIPALMRQAHISAGKIDLAEQWSRPVYQALHDNNIMIPARYCTLGYEFTSDDVSFIADIITKVPVNNLNGIVIDEAQDLSLCQLMFYLAMAYRKGEMTVIGDDKAGSPGQYGYKAGQGIYGWRGAFGGSMSLISQLWTKLTGETVKALPLSKTHRCAPEIVDAIQPLNTVLESTRPYGDGFAYQTDPNSAFSIWAGMPEINERTNKPNTAFWITRTNASAAKVFISSVKARIPVCYRGGENFDQKVSWAFSHMAGQPDADGEYNCPVDDAIQLLNEHITEVAGGNEAVAADMIETFILEVMKEAMEDPSIFLQVEGLPARFTLGNLRKFILAFAAKTAARTVTNVYRCKGDEASWVIVSDTDKFNEAWGGDSDEAAACRHVACSRAIDGLIICGPLAGVICPAYTAGTIGLSDAPVTVKMRTDEVNLLAKVTLTRITASHYTYTHYTIRKIDGEWNLTSGDKLIQKFPKLGDVKEYLGRM